jgi:outer membrane protein, heavy metal efflux system
MSRLLLTWMSIAFTSVCTIMMLGCAQQTYQPKPISVENTSKKLSQKSSSSPEFRVFLSKQGYPTENWPIQVWGIEELTYSALFHHAALDLAKAKLALAESNIDIAELKPTPTASAILGRSNQANNDISPWTYGLQVDIPIETANKREIRVEEAQQLANATRMDVAETAWQLRHQLTIDLIDFQENQSTIKLLQQETAAQQQLFNILQKRLALGLSSNTEISKAALDLKRKEGQLINEQTKTNAIIAKIATDAGLSLDQFKPSTIQQWSTSDLINRHDAQIQSALLQQEALLNRIDIRRSLANYAAAEAKIRLEIAKQTPDFSLTPGLLFEFGDKIWSLGFSSLLQFLNNQQPTMIKHAERLRDVEGAQFEALQANVIGQLAHAQAQYISAKQALNQLSIAKKAEEQQLLRVKKQFDAGLIDRLALTQASLASLASEQLFQQAQFTLLRMQANIENILQKPLLKISRN